jgi:hypothetical protein
LEFLGSLPDLRLDAFLLLSRAQTPERPLGILCCPSIIIDLVQEGRVELSLCVNRCGRLPSLSANGTVTFFTSFVWQRSSRCRDPAPLISRWRKSQNGRLDFFTGSRWLRWHRGVDFSFVTVSGVVRVSVVVGLGVVVVTVVFENWYEVFEAETLLIVFVVVEISVSNHVVENAGLRRINVMSSFWIFRVFIWVAVRCAHLQWPSNSQFPWRHFLRNFFRVIQYAVKVARQNDI